MKRILLIVAAALSLAMVSAGQQGAPPEPTANPATRHASKHHRHHRHSTHHGKHHGSSQAPKG